MSGDLVVTSNSSLDNRVWSGMKSTPSDFLRGQDPAMASSNEMEHRIGVLATPLSFSAPYHSLGSVRHNEGNQSVLWLCWWSSTAIQRIAG